MRVDSASFFDDMAFVAAALVSADPCLCFFLLPVDGCVALLDTVPRMEFSRRDRRYFSG